jgi:hypothetical protein
MKTYNLGKLTFMYFFGGDICFTYQFLEDQKLKQERSCEFWKKNYVLSDLTPYVRSYPVLWSQYGYGLTTLPVTMPSKKFTSYMQCWGSGSAGFACLWASRIR